MEAISEKIRYSLSYRIRDKAESCAVEPREDQIRIETYQAICRHCGWQGEAHGISAVEMRSGVERRTAIRNK